MPRAYAAVFDGHNGAGAAEHAADRLHHVLAAEAALRTCTGVQCHADGQVAASCCGAVVVRMPGMLSSSRQSRALLACRAAGEGPPATALREEERVAAALVHSFEAVDREIMTQCRLTGTKGGATGLVLLRMGALSWGQRIQRSRGASSAAMACGLAGCSTSRCLPCRPAGNQLYAAHCGDTRAVLSRSGEALRLTEDHKPNLPRERKRVEVRAGRWRQWPGGLPLPRPPPNTRPSSQGPVCWPAHCLSDCRAWAGVWTLRAAGA